MKKKRLFCLAQDVPQLLNVIFSATEWTANAASRYDLEQHFLELKGAESKVGPLRTIIIRVLLYQPRQSERQSTIIAGCANLITTVLLSPACNVTSKSVCRLSGSAYSFAMKKALRGLLIRGRTLVLQIKAGPASERLPTPEQVANNISSCILNLLQRASKEKYAHEMRLDARQMNRLARGSAFREFSSQDHAEEIVQHLEVEINALESELSQQSYVLSLKLEEPNCVNHTPSVVVLNLLTKRDRIKKLADISGLVLDVSLGRKSQFENQPQREASNVTAVQAKDVCERKVKSLQDIPISLAHFQSVEAKHELIQRIIGSPLLNSISSSNCEVPSLPRKFRKLHLETSCELSNLSSRQKSISSMRKEIAQHVDHLQRELKELEMQDQRLAKEETDISSALGQIGFISESEAMVANQKVSSNAEYLEVDQEVQWTVESLGELEWAWIRLCSSTLPWKMSLTSLLSIKLDQYLHHVHSYFQTEVQSIDIINDRILSVKADMLDLESELQLCLALGMSTNVQLITHDLAMLKSQVNEDNIAIDALKKDIREMKLDLICRVEDFCWSSVRGEQELVTISKIDTGTLSPSHLTVLEEISLELTGMETDLDLDDKMGGIFSRKRISSLKTSPKGTQALSFPTRSDLHSIPLVVPKFSWANKINNTLKKETTSFLDIQREEMSRK